MDLRNKAAIVTGSPVGFTGYLDGGRDTRTTAGQWAGTFAEQLPEDVIAP